jgi:hypothetical protein
LEIELAKEVRAMGEQLNGDRDTGSKEHAGNRENKKTSSRSYGRRALMLGAATAGAGAAASLVATAEPAVAADGSAVLLGKSNKASATTKISTKTGDGLEGSTSAAGSSGVYGNDTSGGGGYGAYGESANGTGVYGTITGDTSGHFAVEGTDQSTGDGGGAGVGGSSTNGTGVYGTSTNGTGVYGSIIGDTSGKNAIEGVDASTGEGGGAGVTGSSTNGTGVIGTSTNGVGVTGIHSTGSGSAVAGIDDSGNSGSHGVYGSSSDGSGVYGTSTDGSGVYGISTNGRGVNGSTASDTECGIYGANTSTTFVQDGPPGASGVFGTTTNPSYGAVYGYDSSSSASHLGSGVYGFSENGYGLYCLSLAGTALYADGNAQVTGTLSKGGGSFKIDHPLDPADKFLYHSFVESPDMKNVYDGTVTLDVKGEATVELPDWFEALNRDYRYQLTAIGGPSPQLHISLEVKDGKFSIAGGEANQKVSWQVTGIRQDAWANANRIPVEVEKAEVDRGRYLHPDLFGGEGIASIAKGRDHGRRHHINTPAV